MSNVQRCLIIVPRGQAELCSELVVHFARDSRVVVRFDARHGDRAADGVGIFAVGGGDLDPQLREYVEEQLRLVQGSRL